MKTPEERAAEGARLRAAREAEGFSSTSFADWLDWTPEASLLRMEAGEEELSSMAMTWLIDHERPAAERESEALGRLAAGLRSLAESEAKTRAATPLGGEMARLGIWKLVEIRERVIELVKLPPDCVVAELDGLVRIQHPRHLSAIAQQQLAEEIETACPGVRVRISMPEGPPAPLQIQGPAAVPQIKAGARKAPRVTGEVIADDSPGGDPLWKLSGWRRNGNRWARWWVSEGGAERTAADVWRSKSGMWAGLIRKLSGTSPIGGALGRNGASARAEVDGWIDRILVQRGLCLTSCSAPAGAHGSTVLSFTQRRASDPAADIEFHEQSRMRQRRVRLR